MCVCKSVPWVIASPQSITRFGYVVDPPIHQHYRLHDIGNAYYSIEWLLWIYSYMIRGSCMYQLSPLINTIRDILDYNHYIHHVTLLLNIDEKVVFLYLLYVNEEIHIKSPFHWYTPGAPSSSPAPSCRHTHTHTHTTLITINRKMFWSC